MSPEAPAAIPPAAKLAELIKRHGRPVLDNPEHLEGILRNECAGQPRDIHVLMVALRNGIPARLLKANTSSGVPLQYLSAPMTRTLEDDCGLDADVARWSVNSWSLALGLVQPADHENYPMRVCPFCGAQGASLTCFQCRRDTTLPRRICPHCGKMSPLQEATCASCHRKFVNERNWKIPLAIGIVLVLTLLSYLLK
jgi:hypothetical protein